MQLRGKEEEEEDPFLGPVESNAETQQWGEEGKNSEEMESGSSPKRLVVHPAANSAEADFSVPQGVTRRKLSGVPLHSKEE